MDKSNLKNLVESTPGLPDDEERRKAASLLTSSLYVACKALPSDKSLLVSTAIKCELECRADASQYRSEVRRLISCLKSHPIFADKLVSAEISASDFLEMSKHPQSVLGSTTTEVVEKLSLASAVEGVKTNAVACTLFV